MSDSVFYDSIHILESLRDGDLKTGSDLADHLEYGPHKVKVRFRRPSTKSEFLECLADVATEARTGNHSPLIHIEAHGATPGLELSSGEFMLWSEMSDVLTGINVVSRLNLFVLMAACQGSHLTQIVQPIARAPVWGLVGPMRDITAGEIQTDFRAFYDEFFMSRNGRRALERLNNAPVGPTWRYAYFTARFLFRIVFQEYLKACATPTALKEREDLLVRQIVGERPAPAELRESLRAALANHDVHFQRMRREFFMIDLFPENDKRFPLTLAHCQRDPADDPDEPSSEDDEAWP